MSILILFFLGVISFTCVTSYPTGEYVAKEKPFEEFLEEKPNVKLFKAENKTYYFAPTFITGTYFQAVQFCNSHNMKLLSIETEEESKLLLDAFQKFLNRKSFYAIWTSGTRLPNDEWMWLSTGYNMVYTNWESSQPDLGDEKCVEAYYEPSEKSLFWHDWSCEASAHIVCENSFSVPINTINNKESTTDNNIVTTTTDYIDDNNIDSSIDDLEKQEEHFDQMLDKLKELNQEIDNFDSDNSIDDLDD